MAKINFSKEFAVKRTERLPKLTLDKDEKARVAIVSDLEAEFVHNVRKITIDDETGGPLIEVQKNSRGEEYERNAMEFVAKWRCTGDFDTVSANGTDGENCQLCAAAEQSSAFERPRRYMVALVFRYRTKPDTYTVAAGPFQGEIVPWIFSDGKWTYMSDIDEENESVGGVTAVDLMLGPCKSQSFQNYDIRAARDSYYQADNKRKRYVEEMLESYDEDTSTLFGRIPTDAEASRTIREVQDRYDEMMNPSGAANDNIRSSSAKATDELFSGKKRRAKDDDEDDVRPSESASDDDDDEDDDDNDASDVADLSDLIDID